MNLQEEMPILQSEILHLLHCGVSPLSKRALDALDLYRDEMAMDPIGTFNSRINRINKVRIDAGKLLRCKTDEIAFIKSTTHGLLLMAHSIDWKQGDVIIVEESTFPANWYTWKELESRFGVKLVEWPERNFRYELNDLEDLLEQHSPRLVSVSAADYATGFRHNLKAVGERVKSSGAIYGIDGIQTVGVVPVDVKDCHADFLSADGHKWMLGPEGAGLLYINQEFLPQLSTAFSGWIGRKDFMNFESRTLQAEDNARRFEEGALNMPGILALGGSLSLINEMGIDQVWERVWKTREAIHEWAHGSGAEIISPTEKDHATGTLSIRISGDAAEYVKQAAEHNIHISNRRGFVRFAPHFYQGPEIVERLEKLS